MEVNKATYNKIHEDYNVAVKAFVRKGDYVLLFKDIANEWDLPGGRININEFDKTIDEILERELYEEFGDEIKFKNNGVVCMFRHKRLEIEEGKREIKIFMIGFEIEYLNGDLNLSKEHSEYKWVSLDKAAEYLSGGQKDGLKKYIEYIKNGRNQIVC